MNAIEFLMKEHQHVKHVLAEIANKSHREETKKTMFDDLCHDILRHESMEHKVWYPHFKNDSRLNGEVKHLLTEEKEAEKAIKQFDNVNSFDEWEQKFSKFKRDVESHAAEEEKLLFPQVKKIIDEQKLEKIGKDMAEFKKNYEE